MYGGDSAEGDAPRVGILALQGGVAEHVAILSGIGAEPVLVRRAEQLDHIDAIILPGGESSTIDRLLRTFDLAQPLAARIRGGLPTLGTCAGLVLLARTIEDPAPGQQSLGILDIAVRRNAFGSQVASEETIVQMSDGPVRAAFIRAPVVTEVGADVQVIAHHRGQVVAVRSGAVTGISFHPELAGDATLHRQLVERASAARPVDGVDANQEPAVTARAH
ncbi:MAG: pyridoxal 5'-phosphate synthase glutaminase subunit PdxT [Actinomycetota bacterium]|nr:pyridoxal 5'-phosphate synthase glutaminase subunit PdxT [Actinomycetota bacterium]